LEREGKCERQTAKESDRVRHREREKEPGMCVATRQAYRSAIPTSGRAVAPIKVSQRRMKNGGLPSHGWICLSPPCRVPVHKQTPPHARFIFSLSTRFSESVTATTSCDPSAHPVLSNVSPLNHTHRDCPGCLLDFWLPNIFGQESSMELQYYKSISIYCVPETHSFGGGACVCVSRNETRGG
jgi:hypothetical protein